MAILRRDETPDLLGPKLLHVWRRKWWIVGPAFAVLLLTYVGMVFWPSEFKASAEIYVNRLIVAQVDEVRSPTTVASLLESSHLLRKVRDEYQARFGQAPVFEKFVKQFKTKTQVVQDTTVKKDVSPVVSLTVQTVGAEQARFLIESWTRLAVKEFGNYASAEAREKVAALTKEDERLENELKTAEGLRAKYAAELPLHAKMLAEKLDLLTPSELPEPVRASMGSLEGQASSFQVVMDQALAKPVRGPGLVARLSEAQLAVERAKIGARDGGTSPVLELEHEVQVVSSSIARTRADIESIQGTVADLRQKLDSVTREVQVKTQMQQQLHKYMDHLNAVAAAYREWDGQGLPSAGDLRVLSQPVLPELRAWPKRTLVAGIAAVTAFMICLAGVLVSLYLRELVEAQGKSS
jgi:uncharacterized protein involved in exopolysaccharide biosynthesis